jgi:hypothetical protein
MYFDEYVHKYVFKVFMEAITYLPYNHFKSSELCYYTFLNYSSNYLLFHS